MKLEVQAHMLPVADVSGGNELGAPLNDTLLMYLLVFCRTKIINPASAVEQLGYHLQWPCNPDLSPAAAVCW